MSAENDLIIVLCTVPDDAAASNLARGLVERGLAACVNAVPDVTSHYRWEGALEIGSEILLLIKTRAERFEELSAWIGDNHPYDVPEIVALRAAHVNDAYMGWALAQIR